MIRADGVRKVDDRLSAGGSTIGVPRSPGARFRDAPAAGLGLRLVGSATMVIAVTATIGLLDREVPARGLEVLYIPPILAAAVLGGLGYALAVSIMGALAFDWYYLPPRGLALGLGDLISLAVLVGCALVVSELASRAHVRARVSERARGLIAEEQAALRRVATLVAGEAPTAEVFPVVCEELARLMAASSAGVCRYEDDGATTIVASWPDLPSGQRPEWEGNRPAGDRKAIVAPIVVSGRVWGVISASASHGGSFADVTKERLVGFAELVSMAIANAAGRAELQASRTRIVATADAERRRIERDLHDGAQQRLVALALEVRSAEMNVPPDQGDVRRRLDHVARELGIVLDDLREISRGIHPALLTDLGLKAAVRSLARRSALPVEVIATSDARFPEPVEVAAYYVVSEAIVNATKHSQASIIRVELAPSASHLTILVTDDGVGGADPSRGSGLVGLADRVGALGGRCALSSPVGRGTALSVEFPLERDEAVPDMAPGLRGAPQSERGQLHR